MTQIEALNEHTSLLAGFNMILHEANLANEKAFKMIKLLKNSPMLANIAEYNEIFADATNLSAKAVSEMKTAITACNEILKASDLITGNIGIISREIRTIDACAEKITDFYHFLRGVLADYGVEVAQ